MGYILLLLLLLSWDANIEPDLAGYSVMFAERYPVYYYSCPTPENPDQMCPAYNEPPIPEIWWEVDVGNVTYVDLPCGNFLNGVCFYKGPIAYDLAGNESERAPLPPEAFQP